MVPASLANFTVGSDQYLVRVEPRCHLCASPKRAEAERLIAAGRTYRSVVTELSLEPGVSARNVADHYRAGHLPVQAAAIRQVARERSEEASHAAAGLVQGVAGSSVVRARGGGPRTGAIGVR